MSAAGRLWRRAPAWRFCLIAGLGCTALAALFPPRWPHGHATRAPAQAADSVLAPKPAHFALHDAPVPAEGGSISLLPSGRGTTGIIPFAGRQVPLPAGTWETLAIARQNGSVSIQVKLLARIEQRRVTGLLLVAAPDPVNGANAPMVGDTVCFDPTAIASDIAPPPPDHDPIIHECWTLARESVAGLKLREHNDGIFTEGFGVLAAYGAQLPQDLVALRYTRSNLTGWMQVTFLAPDQPSNYRRLGAWARRYAVELHRGFSLALTAKDVAGAVTRDPG